jgi:hypothetical protein
MAHVNPPNNPIEPTTFATTLATMVSVIEADAAEAPKTDCEKAYLLREALLRFIEQNCPSPL